MKILNKICLLSLLVGGTVACSDNDNNSSGNSFNVDLTYSPTEIKIGYEGGEAELHVTSNREWGLYTPNEWIKCTPSSSIKEQQLVNLTIAENATRNERTGYIIFMSGVRRDTVKVYQEAQPKPEVDDTIIVPEGYELVWNDEFNEGVMPNGDLWYYETGYGDNGWGNNELQNYVAGSINGTQIGYVSDGTYKITAQKINGTVYSIRINTREAWTYGYFEARLKLPGGKGTWPAFWMMPKNFTSWPADGEIDIMEEVGYRPNWVSSAIHCNAYNGMHNTHKTGELFIPTAESGFHVYALEWTEDYLRTYCDGELMFQYLNDGKGNDSWPFNKDFYIKLNLAWGGNWGGAQGVDESALPATYEIDYVRVFQKK